MIFLPTHKIIFRHLDGSEEVYPVVLDPGPEGNGPAYTKPEWDGGLAASWEYSRETGWRCQGQPTPGGQCGTVSVEKLPQIFLVSFRFSDFEAGECTATVYPRDCAVSGDFVCLARTCQEAENMLQAAAHESMAAPEGRPCHQIDLTWVYSDAFFRLAMAKQ